MLAEGIPSRPRCINVVALKRHEFPPDTIEALSQVHRLLYRSRVGLDHARDILRADGRLLPQVEEVLNFVQTQQDGTHGRARQMRRAA
jgi:UDP-N-acetylglucosamine acyltransferase